MPSRHSPQSVSLVSPIPRSRDDGSTRVIRGGELALDVFGYYQ
jgi:hypothetical protein